MFVENHPLKNETITVMLKEHLRKKFYPVPAKYRARVIDEATGREKEIFVWLNGLGLQKMDYSAYLDMSNKMMKSGDKFDTLNAKQFEFTADITHVNEQMNSDREIGVAHRGVTLMGNDESTEADRIWWLNNPKCVINGEPNGIDTIFEVTVVGAAKKKKMVSYQAKLEISNFISSISEESVLFNIFHFFGLNPEGKTMDEMKISLLEGDIEVLADGNKEDIKPIIFTGSNDEDFRKTFMNNDNPSLNKILVINKAKHYNIIILTTIQSNRGWYYNQSFLGTTDTELQSYFTVHQNVFEAISSKVERIEKSKFPAVEKNRIPDAAKVVNEKVELLGELMELVRANKITIPEGVAVNNLGVEDLKGYIALAKTPKEPEEQATDLIYFERQKEGEANGDYRFRIMAKLKELTTSGKLKLSEGTHLNKLKAPDIEVLLIAYEKTLTSAK